MEMQSSVIVDTFAVGKRSNVGVEEGIVLRVLVAIGVGAILVAVASGKGVTLPQPAIPKIIKPIKAIVRYFDQILVNILIPPI